MAQSDRVLLDGFLDELQRDIGNAVLAPIDLIGGISADDVQDFWEFLGGFVIVEELQQDFIQAWEVTATRFDSVRAELSPDTVAVPLDRQLEDVGLTGPELTLKINAYRALRKFDAPPLPDRLLRTARRPWEERRRGQLRRWLRRQLARFGRALGVANAILGSLAAAGLAGVDPIKEFKEVLEASLSE